MDDLRKEQAQLSQKADYTKAIDQVDVMIELLKKTRESIAADPKTAQLQIAKLKMPVKKGFEEANSNLKQVNSALKAYDKALQRKFKPFEEAATDTLSSQSYLINRAIAMHLLREGQFDVATTFFNEVKGLSALHDYSGIQSPHQNGEVPKERDWEVRSESLQQQFAEMYHILEQLRKNHNLDPAIEWARAHSDQLKDRGSNLEFELCRLRFVALFLGYDTDSEDIDMEASLAGRDIETTPDRIFRATAYASTAFAPFHKRYSAEIFKLIGAISFWNNFDESPYASLFSPTVAWEEACTSFSREFCNLLGLSPASPLYVACTAGAMALPVLAKVQVIMRQKRTEWTTQEELPVEIPLPPSFQYHSIFVCPVSKEQATDKNPPVMLPCGHVLCKDSVRNYSKGIRFKCPYCPVECMPKDLRTVYL